jgi:serine protease Do
MKNLFKTQFGWALLAGAAIGAVGMGVFMNSRPFAIADPSEIVNLTPNEMEVLAALDSASVKLTQQTIPSVVQIVNNRRMGEGSGVIYRADGYIITNEHVVSGADEVDVVFYDGRTEKGKVYRDSLSDIAVVKVNRKGLQPAVFADSDQVKPGQLAFAVGSPFGQEQSITFGHVSAVGRSNQVPDFTAREYKIYADMIQTDAAINPGNSGGPLLNYKGAVIGINTVISTTTGGSHGVGYSIPANTAKLIAGQLIKNEGRVLRSYLGLRPENLKLYQKQDLNVKSGVYVSSVEQGTPADKAGLKVGDVIIEMAGRQMRSEVDVRNSTLLHRPGESVEVKYIRDGKVHTTRVVLEDREKYLASNTQRMQPRDNPFAPFDFDPFGEGNPVPPPRERGESMGAPAVLGVTVRGLTDEERTKVPGNKGVMVEEVTPNSVAQRAGVRQGVIIAAIGKVKVDSPEELRNEISKYKTGDSTTLSYVRIGRSGSEIMSATVTIRF